MSVFKGRLLLSKEPGERTHRDCSRSADSAVEYSAISGRGGGGDLKDLVAVLQEFVGRQKEWGEWEPRDRGIAPALPNSVAASEELSRFLWGLCREVWSRGFHYYSSGQLSLQNTKIYCSQQILENLGRLTQHCRLGPEEFALLDRELREGVLGYMLSKYPMTLNKQPPPTLAATVRETDDSDNPLHNYLQGSQVVFRLRESGEYNDLIMRTLNDTIAKIETKIDGRTMYERFEEKMRRLFESVENYEWVHGIEEGRQVEERDSCWLLMTLNGIKKKHTLDELALKNEYSRMRQKDREQYQQQVKQYTHYLIGRKLPESARPFTEEQITSHRLRIENPQILRILTKWCEELQKKFQHTSWFQHFLQGQSLQRSTFLNLVMGQVRDTLSALIAEERKNIQAELEQLAQNNYRMQSELFLRASSPAHPMGRQQHSAAHFASAVVNNLHSYVITYLNRLIHGLLAVLKRFQQSAVAQQIQLSLNASSSVSFQVMDLVRCKCSSRQKEVLKLYQQILKRCEQGGSLSLIRVVNRLKGGTHDILINVKYRQVICQIQLAVTHSTDSFIEHSNHFNHYLYQLKRAAFGPITELAGIWKNLDPRFGFYQSLKQSSAQSRQEHSCGQGLMPYSKPFICSVCSRHHFHNKFIRKHLKCRSCDYWVCAQCQILEQDCKQLLVAAFNSDQIMKKSTKIDFKSPTLPQYGLCIYIQSQQIIVEPFRTYDNKHSMKVIGIKNKKVYKIYEISSDNQRQKFLSKFLVFGLEQQYGKKHVKISNEAIRIFLLQQKYRTILSKNRQTLNFTNQGIQDKQLQKLVSYGKDEQKASIKNVELIGNKLTCCSSLTKEFRNVVKLDLSKNRMKEFFPLRALHKLEKIVVNSNELAAFPIQICGMRSLKDIYLNENQINAIPTQISYNEGLLSLHASFNKITSIPTELFGLRSLTQLNLKSNYIKQIPKEVGKAENLKILLLQNNYIKVLPKELKTLQQLQRLNLSHNKLQQIPALQCLKSLLHLNLRNNNIIHAHYFFQAGSGLKELDLSYNRIQLIGLVGSFPKLKFLNISHNLLSNFPRFQGAKGVLRQLLMANNKIKSTGNLDGFINLQQLHLGDNLLQEIDESICRLDALLVLTAENNRIKKFSNCHLQRLLRFNLRRNKITQARCLQMRSLEELDLSENQLMLFQLNFFPRLRRINLGTNKLQDTKMDSFPRLVSALLPHNMLKIVPSFHPHSPLRQLNLEHNNITQVPPNLSVPHLTSLNLSNNLIRVIPSQLSNLSNLKQKSLFLRNNPIQAIECLAFVASKCSQQLPLPTPAPNQRDMLVSITVPFHPHKKT